MKNTIIIMALAATAFTSCTKEVVPTIVNPEQSVHSLSEPCVTSVLELDTIVGYVNIDCNTFTIDSDINDDGEPFGLGGETFPDATIEFVYDNPDEYSVAMDVIESNWVTGVGYTDKFVVKVTSPANENGNALNGYTYFAYSNNGVGDGNPNDDMEPGTRLIWINKIPTTNGGLAQIAITNFE